MSSYQATTPPADARCESTATCGSVAKVRVLVPRSRFMADGVDHCADPDWCDMCELHWTILRDTCVRNGHQVVDTTGSLRDLVAEFPEWKIFYSDGGRLYAAARLNGSVQGTTVDACLVGQLRARMQATARGADPA